MIRLDLDLTRTLERVGKALGLPLGRAHYFHTVIVPQAVDEWLERRAGDPATAAVVRPILDDYRRLQLERNHQRVERRQRRAADRRRKALEDHAPDDALAYAFHGRPEDRSGTAETQAEVRRTLIDLAKAGRRDDFIDLARMTGCNSPDRAPFTMTPDDLWRGTRKRLGLPEGAA